MFLNCNGMHYQIESTKSRVVELVEATMQLSNLDIVVSYVFKGEKHATPATSRIQNDIIDPSVSSVQVSFWLLTIESRLYCTFSHVYYFYQKE
jgi:hypothetical protein